MVSEAFRYDGKANVVCLREIGFPAWTGGPVRYGESYPGLPAFRSHAAELAARDGMRYAPPAQRGWFGVD